MPPLVMSAASLQRRLAWYLGVGALLPAVLLVGHRPVAAAIALSLLAGGGGLRWLLRGQIAAVAKPQGKAPVAAAPGPTAQEDGLTGIASRSALEARLEEEWKRERRTGEPTAVVLIAVDGFSALQEEGARLSYDVALLTLARALTRQLPRRADLLGRYDESTFAVVLPGTDLPGTLRVAARLRWAIVRLGIAHPRSESGFVTACLGITVQHGLTKEGSRGLFAAAEGALRTAQEAGPDHLEYVVLQGEDRPGLPAPAVLTMPSMRPWTPERETLRPSQG